MTMAPKMEPHEHIILEINRERERQMSVEGWTRDHDDTHDNEEMRMAAVCYALGASDISFEVVSRGAMPSLRAIVTRTLWEWDLKWWKPGKTRRNLIKSAALLVAEIERIDRAEARRRSA